MSWEITFESCLTKSSFRFAQNCSPVPAEERGSSKVLCLFVCSLIPPHKKITTASGVKLAGDYCVLTPSPSAFQDDAPKRWGENTFGNRQEMCKIMRGFYARAITINRAMGYIASGEHRKWTSHILSISTTVPKPKIEIRRNISGPLSDHRHILPWSLTTVNYQPSSTLGCTCCTSQPFYWELTNLNKCENSDVKAMLRYLKSVNVLSCLEECIYFFTVTIYCTYLFYLFVNLYVDIFLVACSVVWFFFLNYL